MKTKRMKIFLASMICFIMFAMPVMAVNMYELEIKEAEYTEEYQKWLKLSDDEKNKVIQPKKYKINQESVDILEKTSNPFKRTRMLRSSGISRFSLQNIISDNVKVKNQQETNSCWAFVALRSFGK